MKWTPKCTFDETKTKCTSDGILSSHHHNNYQPGAYSRVDEATLLFALLSLQHQLGFIWIRHFRNIQCIAGHMERITKYVGPLIVGGVIIDRILSSLDADDHIFPAKSDHILLLKVRLFVYWIASASWQCVQIKIYHTNHGSHST